MPYWSWIARIGRGLCKLLHRCLLWTARICCGFCTFVHSLSSVGCCIGRVISLVACALRAGGIICVLSASTKRHRQMACYNNQGLHVSIFAYTHQLNDKFLASMHFPGDVVQQHAASTKVFTHLAWFMHIWKATPDKDMKYHTRRCTVFATSMSAIRGTITQGLCATGKWRRPMDSALSAHIGLEMSASGRKYLRRPIHTNMEYACLESGVALRLSISTKSCMHKSHHVLINLVTLFVERMHSLGDIGKWQKTSSKAHIINGLSASARRYRRSNRREYTQRFVCFGKRCLSMEGSITQGLHTSEMACAHKVSNFGHCNATSAKACTHWSWRVCIGRATIASSNVKQGHQRQVSFGNEMLSNGRQDKSLHVHIVWVT
uniref:Uncharacterized protein n=1 Tax=Solanum lycopersicum TaxID=4081 RepID=A0A3Q7GJ76_SOLLC